MNCCDEYGNCNQGRDCPARVAKVGRKDHGKEPLRGSSWRRQLRYLAAAMLMCLAVMLVSAIVSMLLQRTPVRIDCSLAEFSPDITPAAKSACREARANVTRS